MTNKIFEIDGRKIGIEFPPYIIAEMSGNHNNSFDRALKILDAAKNVGANAIKLQTYKPETMTIDVKNKDFLIDDKESLWKNKYLFDLYQEAHTPWDWIEEIIKESKKKNITCFSSVFDETSIDFLENLNISAYKIASFENNHIPLIKKVASTKKPIIISLGLVNETDIEEIVQNAYDGGCEQLALLKCTSNYPSSPLENNLKTIPYLRDRYNCEIGLSDHTLGIGAALGGIALGATIIEKHLTLSKKDKGVDSDFSADKDEFELLVKESLNTWESLGKISFKLSEKESKSLKFKRSIYITKPIKKGDKLSKNNIKIIRPGYGMEPKNYDLVLGKKAKKNLNIGKRLLKNDID